MAAVRPGDGMGQLELHVVRDVEYLGIAWQ